MVIVVKIGVTTCALWAPFISLDVGADHTAAAANI